MSWSSTYALPPRRSSRSRSPPGNSTYPPRPAYPDQDPSYRNDEFYDRERDRFDRNRQGYDYPRRRSRSPQYDESRKRRRSLSPYDRDRYEPRPRYDDHDGYVRGGHSPLRRGHQNRRVPPDPHTFDYPASLKQFAEWFRYFHPQQATEEDSADKAAEQEAGDGSKPRNGIRSRWEKYKKDFAAMQLQTMFDHHRKSPWFAEKYDPSPEFQKLRLRVRKEGWKGHVNTFLLDLETGKFDPDVNELAAAESSSTHKDNGEPSKEANGSNTNADEPAKATGDDEAPFTIEPEEDAPDVDQPRGDTNGRSSNRNQRNDNRGEEVSVHHEGNQVMIRTIPPDIGRLKLEAACNKIPGYLYLALGDPLQKRNYYRAGWLRFSDDADMDAVMAELQEKKIEGFKLHVSHTTRPFTNRLRYAPEVTSRPERIEKDLHHARTLSNILEEEAAALRKLKIRPESSSEEGGDNDDVRMNDGALDEEEEPPERGSEAVERHIEKIMLDAREQGRIDTSDAKSYEEKKNVISLDLYIAYLRAAYNTCYYCCVTTDHVEELQRKCIQHVRKPLTKAMIEELKESEKFKMTSEQGEDVTMEEKDAKKEPPSKNKDRHNDERWLEWLDSKIALLINREGVDPREYGGKSYDDELHKVAEPFVKQEDEGKFRCKHCSKLFKATSFVEKHIANKHPELVKGLDDLPYFNNFALDPHRIQPFAHPPPTTGSSSAAPPQAYGIQAPPPTNSGRNDVRYGDSYSNGQWSEYGGPVHYGMQGGLRREDGMGARRLSDRISGYTSQESTLPLVAGLPAKPMLDGPLIAGNTSNKRNSRSGSNAGGAPPPPPPHAKEDPRAAAGRRVSYHDMDLVAEGDVELFY